MKTKIKSDNIKVEISGLNGLTAPEITRLTKSFDRNVSNFLRFALNEFGLQTTNLEISIDMERDQRPTAASA